MRLRRASQYESLVVRMLSNGIATGAGGTSVGGDLIGLRVTGQTIAGGKGVVWIICGWMRRFTMGARAAAGLRVAATAGVF
jgi:hypothetical protein